GVESSVIDAGFLTTLGIRLASGRDFNESDTLGAPMRMIVSRKAAQLFWPRRDAIGQRARFGSIDGPEITVVGVADDARFVSMTDAVGAKVYLPLHQQYQGWETLVVETRGNPAAVVPAIRAAVAAVDPELPT